MVLTDFVQTDIENCAKECTETCENKYVLILVLRNLYSRILFSQLLKVVQKTVLKLVRVTMHPYLYPQILYSQNLYSRILFSKILKVVRYCQHKICSYIHYKRLVPGFKRPQVESMKEVGSNFSIFKDKSKISVDHLSTIRTSLHSWRHSFINTHQTSQEHVTPWTVFQLFQYVILCIFFWVEKEG